jgi:hypothetical protein
VLETIWLVTPTANLGVQSTLLHAVSVGVTMCGLSTRTCAWFTPEPDTKSRVCQRCRTKVYDLKRHGARKRDVGRPEGCVTTSELVSITKITYRQCDFWCNSGYLRPIEPRPGTGTCRFFAAGEVKVAGLMAVMVKAGVSPEAAHRAARNGGELAPGVRVVIDEAAA